MVNYYGTSVVCLHMGICNEVKLIFEIVKGEFVFAILFLHVHI